MKFMKAHLSDSMYCPLGSGSDEEVREGGLSEMDLGSLVFDWIVISGTSG
jgi:hypothetical protein